MTFLVDDILFAPIKCVTALARKIEEQAENKLLGEEDVRQKLRELYMEFETGRITETEFDEKECELVDQLETIAAYKQKKRRT